MIGKTNKRKFESQRTILKNNNSEIRKPYENMEMKIRKSETQSVSSWARFNYLRDQVLDTI